MKIFYGLGNPDKIYQNTRHNIGHTIIEKFCLQNNISFSKKFNGRVGEYQKNYFLTSDEYMNNSGISAQKIFNFYKINLSDFYVIHDDLDLAVGDYRIQFDRGPAGHHGVESIIEHLGSQSFNSIRIGIGKPQNNIPIEDFVLKPFLPEEKVIIDETIDKILKEISLI
jgi:PTH1 family peptidyl-tRNA hydrolase